MQAIVADLLTLSTLESSPPTDPQAVNMPALIETALSQARALSNGRHQIDTDIDPRLDIQGTSTELSSAISNLLINAVRYTPDGGSITVTWKPDAEGGARYAVVDTGIGIAAHHLPRLTERFYRVDRSRSRESGGTGLGLAITKHIAMRHDAELEITSEPGRGSTFALNFPESRVAA
jgi:two-component system phosphate regulon sensor histidine kinase PhoR